MENIDVTVNSGGRIVICMALGNHGGIEAIGRSSRSSELQYV